MIRLKSSSLNRGSREGEEERPLGITETVDQAQKHPIGTLLLSLTLKKEVYECESKDQLETLQSDPRRLSWTTIESSGGFPLNQNLYVAFQVFLS